MNCFSSIFWIHYLESHYIFLLFSHMDSFNYFNVMNRIKIINQVCLGLINSINRNFFLSKKKTFLRRKTFFLDNEWTLRLKITQVIKIYWNTIDNFCNFTVDLICSHKLTHFFFTWARIWIVGNMSKKNAEIICSANYWQNFQSSYLPSYNSYDYSLVIFNSLKSYTQRQLHIILRTINY